MRSLVNQLNQASDVYYNGKGEILTDYEWDALFDQLKKLEEETGELKQEIQLKLKKQDDDSWKIVGAYASGEGSSEKKEK